MSVFRAYAPALLPVLVVLPLFAFVTLPRDEISACLALDEGRRAGCFQDAISAAASSGDIARAFRLIERTYALDADFAGNCHGNAHEIGKFAYGLFRSNEAFSFPAETSQCGYGFYHGFLEALLYDSGEATAAADFCDELARRADARPDARGACFHGIGHGTVDGTDTRLWGDARGMVGEGIEVCERVALALPDVPPGTGPLFRCVTGAYNALEILSQDKKYELHELEDPISFCLDEPAPYRSACVTNMIPALLRLRDENFPAIIEDLDAAPFSEDVTATLVTDLMHEYVRLHLADERAPGAGGISICRELRNTLRVACIGGLSGGQLKYGMPRDESYGLFRLCALPELLPDERRACWHYGLSRLHLYVSPDDVARLCSMTPSEVRGVCSPGAQL